MPFEHPVRLYDEGMKNTISDDTNKHGKGNSLEPQSSSSSSLWYYAITYSNYCWEKYEPYLLRQFLDCEGEAGRIGQELNDVGVVISKSTEMRYRFYCGDYKYLEMNKTRGINIESIFISKICILLGAYYFF